MLGVVAGADGFGEAGGAFGLQSGEEDRGLDLGRGDRRGEVDGVQWATVDGIGRMAIHKIKSCSHLAEGFADAFHRSRVSEWSPMRVKRCGWGAMRPASMRMVEPELPQSSGPAGWRNAPADAGDFDGRGGPGASGTTVAPSASMQASEECGSAPVEKFESREVPSARPASMA